jgi:tetratricopeptide (TPR) repeat protein
MIFKKLTGLRVSLFSIALTLCFLFGSSVIKSQDKTAAGVYNEGLALLKAKDYEQGLTMMEEALTMAQEINDEKIISLAMKNGAIAAYNVGNSRREAKNYEGAVKAYNRGIELNPEYSSLYEGVARAYDEQDQEVAAVKAYILAGDKGVVEGKDDRAESRYSRAVTVVGKLYVAKDYDRAIKAGNAYIELKNDNADVYYYVSKAQAEKGDNQSAIENINKAIELAGDASPDKYIYAQASTYEALGKNAEAVEAYKKITEETYKAQAEYRIRELGG